MGEENIRFERENSITVRKYKFRVRTKEEHWEGPDSGKMEDMPGNFLEQIVQLIGCSDPDEIESLGAKHQVVLYEQRKETTNEPEGYAKLKHNDLLRRVKSSPDYYIQNLRAAVKKII